MSVMDVNPSGSQIREQEERVMIAVAVVLGLLLIPALFAWFAPGALPVAWSGSGWDVAQPDRVAVSPSSASGEKGNPPSAPVVPVEIPKTEVPVTEIASRAAAAKVARLERENAELQARLSAQEQRLEASIPASEAEAMEKEIATLKGLVAQVNTAAKRNESRATQAGADIAKAQAERDRLAAAEASLRKQLAQETVAAKAARAEQAKLQAQLELARAPKAPEVSPLDPLKAQEEIKTLQARLAAAETDRDSAMGELEKMILREKGGSAMPAPAVDPELARTKSQLVAAQERLRQLEEKLSAQPGVRSEVRTDAFRKSADWDALPAEAKRPGDLWIGAMPLFQTLQQSTSAKETVEVRDAHVQANRLGTLVARIYFGDGAAQPDAKAATALDESLAAVAPGSYLLAVGYASLKGNAIYNENLSSLRAQNVVKRVRSLVDGGKVQMVYFGETSQFDSNDFAKNRVVELWRIDN